jgi:hypothetical protein
VRVTRLDLPGSATIAVVPGLYIILDNALSRPDAALAIAGVCPDVHPDVVDHWLDQCFERPPFLYGRTLRAVVAGFLLAGVAMAGGVTSPHQPPQPVLTVGAHHRPRRHLSA